MQRQYRDRDDGSISVSPEQGHSGAPMGALDPTQIRITHRPLRIDYLITQIEKGELPLTPPFRRESYLWDDGVQSRFIESLFVRIPIPAFYFVATGNNRLLVSDGVKRLTAIARFSLENRVLEKLELERLTLCQLDFLPDLNGKTYDELAPIFQRRITDALVAVYTIDQSTPPAVRYNLFKRVCAGEEPRSAQEIRHALNIGTATNFLAKLANLEAFDKAAKLYKIERKRLLDHEYVLRFIAFTLSPYTEYKYQDIGLFLNESMARLNLLRPDALIDLEQQFKKAMDAVYKIFDRYNDREPDLTAGINGVLLEAWSVNLGKLRPEDILNLIEKRQYLTARLYILLSNHDLKDAITRPTDRTRKVKTRYKMVDDLIKEVVEVSDPWKDENVESTYTQNSIIKKKIAGIVPYGAFAELEEGLYGLIRISNLSWTSSKPNPNEIFAVGDEVEVEVLDVDPERKRIWLSYKHALWTRFHEKNGVGSVVRGKIVRIENDATSVELEKGLEGLIHASNLSWTSSEPNPNEIFTVGDEVEVEVLGVDPERKRIWLSYKHTHWTGLQEKYGIGSVVRGKVGKIFDAGAVVELEKGIEGLIDASNLSWESSKPKPKDFFKVGDEVVVVVLEVDLERKRISLSCRHGPWARLQQMAEAHLVVRGKIVKIVDFGALVELEKDIVGLIHASNLSWTLRRPNTNDFFKIGDEVEVVVLEVDLEERRISLSYKHALWTRFQEKNSVGSVVRGKIVRIANYATFVELEKGLEGRIHISNLSWTLRRPNTNDFFKIGDEVEVVVLEVDLERKRISLSYKHAKENPWPRLQEKYRVGSVVRGKIVKYHPRYRNAFVELEKEVEGRVPTNDFLRAEQRIGKKCAVGDEIYLKVVKVDSGPDRDGKIQLRWNPVPERESQRRIKVGQH